MSVTTYTPGGWLCGVGGNGIVAFPDTSGTEVVTDLWRAVAAGADMAQLLDALLREGFRALPPFALAVRDGDGLHVVVRGAVEVQVTGPSGTKTVSGAKVTTWAERRWADWSSIRFALSPPNGMDPLPVESAVVYASEVSWVLTDTTPVQAPAPVEAPAAQAPTPGPDPSEAPPTHRWETPETRTPAPADPVPAAAVPAPIEPPPAPQARRPSPEQTLLPDPDGASALFAPAPASPPAPADEGNEYDELYGHTRARSVEDGAVRAAPGEASPEGSSPALPEPEPEPQPEPEPEPEPEPGPTPGQDLPGDHDGMTIARKIRSLLPGKGAAQPAADGPKVLARVCPSGHANPVHATSCRVCGEPLSGPGQPVPRPPLGRMRLSTGEVVELTKSAVLGRQPQATWAAGAEMPHIVTVSSEQNDISRSHLQVTVDDWHVLATDLGSTNGSVLHRPGQPPQRLQPNRPMMLASGDAVQIGDGVRVLFEDLP